MTEYAFTGKPYRLRVDSARLNEDMNVIEFHDGDSDKWVVIGWLDWNLRQQAQNDRAPLSEYLEHYNRVLENDTWGIGYLHRLD